MNISDIYNFIDNIAPFDTQCDWDNSGLLIGSRDSVIHKIGFALDADNNAVEQAHASGCDLIVTHHPIIFNPVSNIEFNTPIEKALKYGIAIISAHTNYDKSDKGVNYCLAELTKLTDISALETDGKESMCMYGCTTISDPDKFATFLSRVFSRPITYTKGKRTIFKVAVCGGAGGEFIGNCYNAGMDAFITGEVKHHEYLEAARLGISVFCCGHYETENPAIIRLANITGRELNIETVLLNQTNFIKHTGV